ncbi:Hydrogenase transcriptional regulatory protein hupR1 [Rubripirellula amarantea]|uniref:Hydrogenase transcriptional regulatory protein hupR1 n=1 Tax=Rubripirellula amarantea TaxID=2527999 RepID=A0A5C5WIB7_9BACT|nr:response regulator [Rubripirellula amarantea]TWT50564.1 Hydrogenase transcriptional regulatory protein hupR1 [Rubripirellula amarantea]
MSSKVLLVDDEPNVLKGYQRHLRKSHDIELAVGGDEAIEAIRTQGPFAVVVSDMQMPEMSGVELLSKVRDINEHTVRIMLTGNADQKTAVDAVNEGNIFRFLNKPCSPEKLAQAIDAGLDHYRLVTAEAELLNKTLAGSVRMLTQVLSLAMPEAFGMTQESRRLARAVAERMSQVGCVDLAAVEIGPMWQVEMASMLMRVGCVSLPTDVLRKYLTDQALSADEAKLVKETPQLGYNLVSAIPRLQPVAELIRAQNDPAVDETPIVARILKVIGDYQRFQAASSPFAALQRLAGSTRYDSRVVDALAEIISDSCEIRDVEIFGLKEGMILESNVEDVMGRVLIATGAEVHDAMIQKLALLKRSAAGVREPIRVRVVVSTQSPDHAESGAEQVDPGQAKAGVATVADTKAVNSKREPSDDSSGSAPTTKTLLASA